MNTKPVSLYMKDNLGAIREWRIWAEDNCIFIEYGQKGGAMIRQIEEVDRGKAARTLDEQMMSRMASRISKQKDRGYSNNINDAQNKPVNQLGLKKPMLAKVFGDTRVTSFKDTYIQPKLDGNRCLIANIDGNLIPYSRNGKEIKYIKHILDDIYIPEGSIIDGELYCHGESLQTIVSWIKREQPNNLKIKYHAYDIITEDEMPFKERNQILNRIQVGDNVSIVETHKVSSIEECVDYFKLYRKNDYEGAIIRLDGYAYEDGKRSSSILKMKEFFDDEFVVVDVNPSKDGWGILNCKTKEGIQFSVTAPGSIPEKTEILKNKHKYIGREVKVEYTNITADKKPFHPVAICFRDLKDE